MDLSFFLRGILIGLSIAAPVGPIGVLCMRRTLADGQAAGLASGLGAATADALYGSVAGFGLTLVSGFLLGQGTWIRLGGGLFLAFLGVKTLLSGPGGETAASRGRGLVGAYLSAFLLTLANPMTILSFAAVFAGLGLGSTGAGTLGAINLVTGVFSGSALWWLALSGGVSRLGERVDAHGLVWLNRVSGSILLGFGLAAIFTLAAG